MLVVRNGGDGSGDSGGVLQGEPGTMTGGEGLGGGKRADQD